MRAIGRTVYALAPFGLISGGVYLAAGLGVALISLGVLLWIDDMLPDHPAGRR